jgi:hypothetical protein
LHVASFSKYNKAFRSKNMRGQRTDLDNSPAGFLKRVKDYCNINTNGCWIWKRSTTLIGRPFCSWNKKYDLVYRHTYHAKHGRPIKEDLYACHSCDEKLCCNPDHIFEGTNRDNQLDYIKKHGEVKNGWNSGDTDHYVDGRKKIDLKLFTPSDLNDEERFEWYRDNYCDHDENGCWIWLREIGKDGYGRVRYKQKKHQSHRIMWMLFHNKTPEDLEQLKKDKLVIGHMCPVDGPPNKACCNPAHLSARTRSQNAYDTRKYSKSRDEELYTDEQLYEWLHIYDFVINELGENHKLLKNGIGRQHKFIAEGLINLGLVNEKMRFEYLCDFLRGKSAPNIHREFFAWTPSWK